MIRVSDPERPIWTPALAWAMDMNTFFFVLLSWATPLPPAPPTRKLMPAVLNTA